MAAKLLPSSWASFASVLPPFIPHSLGVPRPSLLKTVFTSNLFAKLLTDHQVRGGSVAPFLRPSFTLSHSQTHLTPIQSLAPHYWSFTSAWYSTNPSNRCLSAILIQPFGKAGHHSLKQELPHSPCRQHGADSSSPCSTPVCRYPCAHSVPRYGPREALKDYRRQRRQCSDVVPG